MNDFVGRLEFAAKHWDKEQGLYERSLEWQAAREIERLTAERDLALANADGVYAKLMAENERLRRVIVEAYLDFSVIEEAAKSAGKPEFAAQVSECALKLRGDLRPNQQRTSNE